MNSAPFFLFKIVVPAGVVCTGGSHDFLAMVAAARSYRDEFRRLLPGVTVRSKLFYPNGNRVSPVDVRGALVALSDKKVSAMVLGRVSAANTPAVGRAQPAPRLGCLAACFLVVLGCAFCQAGVVAPPDSPTSGNSFISADCAFRG